MKLKRVACYLWREWLRPLALPFLFITAAKSAIADINYVPSGSMKPTILEGDVVFINKLAYSARVPFTTFHFARWSEPVHGDIVVCFSPEDGTRLVKRVIARPGDTVELRDNRLILNGTAVSYTALPAAAYADLSVAEKTHAGFAREHLRKHPHAMMVLPVISPLRNFGPVNVPDDHVFVLGDNRDNSKDSRSYGFVRRDQIIGRAKGIFVSGDLTRWGRPRFQRFFSPLD